MVTTSDLEQDVELVKSATVAAGIIATGYFRTDLKTWKKSNASPVSEADIEVDDYLREVLTQARPDYGWLSEESGEQGRLTCPRVFVVDPIDGTRAFLRGDDGWVISVAVVEVGTPAVGVIYAPARDELFEATLGGGARLNGKPLTSTYRANVPAVIPAPTSVHRELKALGLDYERGPAFPSIAYRLMQVATGAMDAVVARRGSHDWDIAAATLILAECGVALEDVCDGPPLFNRPAIVHGALAASRSGDIRPVLHAALKTVYGCPPVDQIEAANEPGSQ
ncbi:MAG TPA: inositol monophosphatase [Devosiaceae bacterium]|nr:inositol monophosphatase [Devosiaceae bacterium]